MPPEAAQCRESRNIRGMNPGASGQLSRRNGEDPVHMPGLQASQGSPPSACASARRPHQCSAHRSGRALPRCDLLLTA